MKTSRFVQLLGVGIGLSLFAACTYKKPETQTPAPAPNMQNQSKAFFTGPEFSKPIAANFESRKTFVCGWAVVSQLGELTQQYSMYGYDSAHHCNIQFEITENKLVGKMINPSFPNDVDRMQVALTIPIKSHFYLEMDKDDKGREKNVLIENEKRSEYEMRPNMRLDLGGIKIESAAFQFLAIDPKVINVEDVEWDEKNNFLGFTIVMSDNYYGSLLQSKYRINLMAFNRNENFKPTPWQARNFSNLNLLHILGKKIDGVHDAMYVAKWDLKKQHPIYLYNFPKQEYKEIVRDIINDWNKSLQDIKAVPEGFQPFVLAEQPAARPFDMRYSTIVWVDDKRINQTSPLGFAQGHADVRNGEIQWGSIFMFANQLEEYVAAFSPGKGVGSPLAFTSAQLPDLLENSLFKGVSLDETAAIAPQIDFRRNSIQSLASQLLSVDQSSINMSEGDLNLSPEQQQKVDARKRDSGKRSLTSNRRDFESTLLERTRTGEISAADLQYLASSLASEATQHVGNSRAGLGQPQMLTQSLIENLGFDVKKKKSKAQDKVQDALAALIGRNTVCTDRTFGSMHDAFGRMAAQVQNSEMDLHELFRVFFKDVTSHEYGHFLGLGHQFKENILPAKGTMPEALREPLVAAAVEGKNTTSLMGYAHPLTTMKYTYDEIVPGLQDQLVLGYLYKLEVPVFGPHDIDAKTFPTVKLPDDGVLPVNEMGDGRKVAFLPQCNDMDASSSVDPLCNRHDMGSNGKEIADFYVQDLDEVLRMYLNNFGDTIDSRRAQYMLLYKSFANIGRLRVFYDQMRRTYADAFDVIRRDDRLLFEFARSCQRPDDAKGETSAARTIDRLFEENPGLKENCQLSGMVVKKLGEWSGLNASDFTKKDFSKSYSWYSTTDGANWFQGGRVTPWTELGALMLKVASLYALVGPYPWTVSDGIYGVPTFNDPSARYVYSSFYPEAYTEAVATMLKGNLKFASLKNGDRTSMGLALYHYAIMSLFEAPMSNDAGILPPQYVTQLRNQTAFSVSYAAVLLSGKEREGSPNRIDTFTGEVYDLESGKTFPLTDVYILPSGQLIAKGENVFIYPMPQAKLRFWGNKDAYIIALKVEYSVDPDDELKSKSSKSILRDIHDNVYNACVIGTSVNGKYNGLSQYFNKDQTTGFKGFEVQPGIARDGTKYNKFLRSVREAFEGVPEKKIPGYYTTDIFGPGGNPKPETCQEALSGLNTIASAAALMNGRMLPEVFDKFQK